MTPPPPPHPPQRAFPKVGILLSSQYQALQKIRDKYLGCQQVQLFHLPRCFLLEVDNLSKKRFKPPKGFVPLLAEFECFLKYNLPEYIRDHRKYITSVLAYEAVTKIIMDLEKCCYEKATGIGLGEELQTIRDSLANANRIEERDQRRETIRKQQENEQRKSNRKQQTPTKLRKTVTYHK